MQALKHPSADAGTQNVHKSNTAASNMLTLIPLILTIDFYVLSSETNMSNFHQLEVVDSGSEAQLQEGENLNKIT